MKDIFGNIKRTSGTVGQKILLVVAALAIIMVILAITGFNPMSVLQGIGRGFWKDIGGTLRWTAPLIFCGLAIAIPFRAGVFNLGIDGQLMLGAVTSAAIGLALFGKMPDVVVIILSLLGGVVAGMIWALIPGFFRVQWGTDEVVTTLLLNYIALLFTDFLVMGPLMGEGSTGTTYSTDSLAKGLWLPRIIPQSAANIGLIIAIVLAIIAAVTLFKTTLGYEIKLVGTNPLFARYGGVRSKRVILTTFLISGAIAGLTGAIEVFGVHHRFPGRFNTGLGFDGVVVSLLAGNNPVGIIFSGFLFGLLRNGAMNMERVTEIPRAMIDMVQAIIVLTATGKFVLHKYKKRKVQLQTAPETGDKNNNVEMATEKNEFPAGKERKQ